MKKNVFMLGIIAVFAFIFMGCPQPPVEEVILESIAVTKNPAKTEYEIGEALDTTGLEVTATYSNKSTEVVAGWTTSGFDSSKAAEKQTVTVSYTENEITKTASFDVKIKEATVDEEPEQKPEDTSKEDEKPAEEPENEPEDKTPADDDTGKEPAEEKLPQKTEHMELIAMDNGCIQINVKGLPAEGTASNFDTHGLGVMENGKNSRIGFEIQNNMKKTEYTYYYPFTNKDSKYVIRLSCVFIDVATGKKVSYDEKAEITAKADYKKFSDYFSIENFDKMKLSSEYNPEDDRFYFIFDATAVSSYKDAFPADKVNNIYGDFGFCTGPTNWQDGATWDGGNSITYYKNDDILYTNSIYYSKLDLFPGEIVKFPVMWGPATSEIIKKIKSKNNTYCAYSYWKFSIIETGFEDSVYMIKKWSDPLEFVEKPIYEGNPFVGKWVAHYENDQTEIIEVDAYGNLIHSFLVNNSLFYALRGRWNPESSGDNTYLWCRQTEGIGNGYTEWTSGVVNSQLELYLNTSEAVPYLTDRWGESKYKKDTSTVSNAEVTVGLINDLDVKIIKTDNNDGTITFSVNYNKIIEPFTIIWQIDLEPIGNGNFFNYSSSITINKDNYTPGNHMVNLMVYASGSFTTIFSDTLYFTVE